MQQYIGVKLINAEPMNRADYNILRGWELPADENGADEGFLVEYLDGGQANHPDFAGYISWSPAGVFENAYRPTKGMTFGLAIEAAKKGQFIARAGWNGKGMFLYFVEGYEGEGGTVFLPYIMMSTATKAEVPWLASQTDILADDWMIV